MYSLAASGSDLYVGGDFDSIAGCVGGDALCNHIARWDGSLWHPLNFETTGPSHPSINAIATNGADVYVGGEFISITGCTGGDNLCQGVARWDGSAWHPVGQGLTATEVRTLALSGSDLYVGGVIVSIPDCVGGDTLCRGIARWDGSAWHPLNAGFGHSVHASVVEEIVVMGADLYVGAIGHAIGCSSGTDSDCTGIARWDGSNWHPVGTGLLNDSDQVVAIEPIGDDLFIGGFFHNDSWLCGRRFPVPAYCSVGWHPLAPT